LKEKLKETADFKIPDEFQKKLDEIPALEAAFRSLTPGTSKAIHLSLFSAETIQDSGIKS